MTDLTPKIVGKIELTAEEEKLLAQVDFDQVRILADREIYVKNSGIIPYLAKSVLKRNAVPEVRRKYLADPEYQSGGTRRSIIDRFHENGNQSEQEVFEHPNFLRHFKYLIFGANLPDAVKTQFLLAVDRCYGVNGSDALELGKLGREIAEQYRLDYSDAPEEFYKLALDCGVHVMWTKTIRDRMKTLKPRKSRGY